jgi:hypothetical protein
MVFGKLIRLQPGRNIYLIVLNIELKLNYENHYYKIEFLNKVMIKLDLPDF